MKIKKYFTYIAVTLTATAITACSSDYLETSTTNKVPEESATSSLNDLYMIVNGLQRKLVAQYKSQGQGGEPGFAVCRDVMGDDEPYNIAGLSWHCDLARWVAHRDPSSTYQKPWEVYYQWVLNANTILNNVENFKDDENHTLYRQVKGEALCFRAFSHFNLVQMYGKRYANGGDNSSLGVPYRFTTGTDPMARNTVEECYTNICKDLEEACELLDGITLKITDVNHCSYPVACGLRARVALTMQDYATAATYAGKAIAAAETKPWNHELMNESMISSCPTQSIFPDITTKTKEAVWAAMTQDDQTVYFYSFWAYMSWNYNSTAIRSAVRWISSYAYNTMSETDARRAWFLPNATSNKTPSDLPTSSFKTGYTGITGATYANRKFTARSSANAVGDYAFMRLAELYLIKAEAEARSGQTAAAQTTFQKFQVTRDPAYTSCTSTGDALIEEIMNSRRVELWGEGFRWFDLKRLNLPLQRSLSTNYDKDTCYELDIPAGDVRWQWLLPKDELNANPLLVQNPLD